MELNKLKAELAALQTNLRQESIQYTDAISNKNREKIEKLEERIHKMLEEIKIKTLALKAFNN